jgi:hypothetical protein
MANYFIIWAAKNFSSLQTKPGGLLFAVKTLLCGEINLSGVSQILIIYAARGLDGHYFNSI